MSIEEFANQLKKFKTYLDSQHIQDEDVNNLKENIDKASNLLDISKTKLIKPFNLINPPDYPDEDLEYLLSYQQEIRKIEKELEELDLTDLKKRVNGIYLKIDEHIQYRKGKGQPKAKERDTNF
jgi:hypothetical protein